MKRILTSLCAAIVLCTLFCAFPVSAEEEFVPYFEDVQITEEELARGETVTGIYDSTDVQTRATGLIISNSIALTSLDGRLIVTGFTEGANGVDKVGFTYVKLQRQINGAWVDYLTLTDQYTTTSTVYSLSKEANVVSGYNYRVICNHYAEKPVMWWHDTQEKYNESRVLYF